MLAGCAAPNVATDSADDALPACTAKGTPFEDTAPFSTSGKTWGELAWSEPYHARVGGVIEEYLRIIGGIEDVQGRDNAEKRGQMLRCTADDYRSVVPAGPELVALARELLPWKNADTEQLSAADAGVVLLEYLRSYECALREHRQFVRENVVAEAARRQGLKPLIQGDLEKEVQRRQTAIDEELRLARPALERTLLLLGGMQRLHPLIADLQCIERVSLDLRNALSLFAEAASCMGRSVDGRSPLRF